MHLTMAMGETMPLRERAIAAYREAEAERLKAVAEEQAQRRAKSEERVRNCCLEAFGCEPDRIDWEAEEAVIDGIRLALMDYGEDDWWFQLVGRCPRCGEECYDEDAITCLESLGEVLCRPFEPDIAHRCGRPSLWWRVWRAMRRLDGRLRRAEIPS